jgi:hypothetical protein
MNPQMQTEAQRDRAISSEAALNETDVLAGWGFTQQEITSLLLLQQWYQTGGSDRESLVRHLKFLRLLVRSGELELEHWRPSFLEQVA